LENKYCVYGHYGDDGVCFYVGIGNKKRPYGFSIRSDFWKNYVKKHCVSGKPEVKIWHSGLTWEQAKEHEIFWISAYGRRDLGTGCLVNLTDGGEGAVGRIFSEETKQKISLVKKGKTHSEETKQKLSLVKKGEKNPRWGKTHSDETKQKISLAGKGKPGKPHSEETKQKLSLVKKGEKNPRWGKTHSEETKQKMSETRKGKTHSDETKQKLSRANKGEGHPMWGKTHSEEAKQKISQARKAREQQKKKTNTQQ
jgi:hypothetical protein